MRALAVFCAATVVFLVYRDLFLPEVREVEVWFGFEVRGFWAIATAPLHWAIFSVAAWAFWAERPWILPAATGYAFYVALSHLVWSEVSPSGYGWRAGVAMALAFSLPGFALAALGRAMRSVRQEA